MNFLFIIGNKPRNISELAKKGDLTLSSASTLISRWSRVNVLTKTKQDGNKGNIITLTDYGKSQVELLKEIKKNYLNNKEYLKTIEKGGEKCKTN